MSHDNFAFEPVRGLPERLPSGERLLWQGAPRWQSLAIHAYHVRKVALYFALLALWSGSHANTLHEALISSGRLLGLGTIAVAVLAALAWATARGTVYSITSKRVVMRHGIAVPLTMNLPFEVIDSAGCKAFADGSGDVALRLTQGQRIGYLISWPHVRRWRLTRPEPTLRAVPDAEAVSVCLATALKAFCGMDKTATVETLAPGLRTDRPPSTIAA